MAKKLNSGNFSTDQLNQLVARIERLEEEKKAIADDIKEVYAEAKAHGFDVKILRQVIRLRKMDKADLAEQETLLQVYMEALGMLVDTPLGDAAIRAAKSDVAGEKGARGTGLVGQIHDKLVESGFEHQGGNQYQPPASSGENDVLYDSAVEIVRKHGKASASMIQRHLEIGYNRASRIIDTMAERGIIGPPDAYGKRPVLEAVA